MTNPPQFARKSFSDEATAVLGEATNQTASAPPWGVHDSGAPAQRTQPPTPAKDIGANVMADVRTYARPRTRTRSSQLPACSPPAPV